MLARWTVSIPLDDDPALMAPPRSMDGKAELLGAKGMGLEFENLNTMRYYLTSEDLLINPKSGSGCGG